VRTKTIHMMGPPVGIRLGVVLSRRDSQHPVHEQDKREVKSHV